MKFDEIELLAKIKPALLGSEHAQALEVKQSPVQLTGVYHNLLRQWAEM